MAQQMTDVWRHLTIADLANLAVSGSPNFPTTGIIELDEWVRRPDIRSRIETRGHYMLAVFVVPVLDPENDEVWQHELYALATHDHMITVRISPRERPNYDLDSVSRECLAADSQDPGTAMFFLINHVVDEFVDLTSGLHGELDEAEEGIESLDRQAEWSATKARTRLKSLRHDMYVSRRELHPLRKAVRFIIDDRLDLDGPELFHNEIEKRLRDTADRIDNSIEELDLLRDLIAALRDFQQAKAANEQNEVMKVLTIVASLLLVPTFIVGMFGQNFANLPWQNWDFGFWGAMGLIGIVIGIELAVFASLGWLRRD